MQLHTEFPRPLNFFFIQRYMVSDKTKRKERLLLEPVYYIRNSSGGGDGGNSEIEAHTIRWQRGTQQQC